jgi:hypothetical protein
MRMKKHREVYNLKSLKRKFQTLLHPRSIEIIEIKRWGK